MFEGIKGKERKRKKTGHGKGREISKGTGKEMRKANAAYSFIVLDQKSYISLPLTQKKFPKQKTQVMAMKFYHAIKYEICCNSVWVILFTY